MPTAPADADAVVARARALADDVLFPAALATDAADVVPVDRLDALADAGLYGLSAPVEVGGLAADAATTWAVIEAIAGGCLTTAFVWTQHLGAARAAAGAPAAVRDVWAAPLARGERRSGVAFAHLRRPGPPAVTAVPDGDGWRVTGTAPWVTGWGRIDVFHAAAVVGDDDVVWALVDARESATLRAERLHLAAVDASATMVVHLADHPVPAERITAREPLRDWLTRDALGLRTNGSNALGVTGRALRLLGELGPEPTSLHAELAAARARLDASTPATVAHARAAATELCVRATTALVAATGGRAVRRDDHAQRLAREAMFLLVQGQTPAIRAAQAELLAGGAPGQAASPGPVTPAP